MKRVTKARPRNCAKCGSSPAGDPSVKLHRFPQPNKVNKPRCELWAKFCFPNNAWKSPKFQSKLYREHKMLCDKHFKSTSIEKEKKLRRPSRLEKNHDMVQENFADVEIVEIKNEPDEDITNIEYSSEATSPQEKRTAANIATNKSPNKTNSQIIKEGLEESAEIDDSLKSTVKDKWDVELPEMSQEDFDETYNEWFSQTSKSDRNDDSQLYGKLITKKLRTYSVHERNLLMYKIDGLLIENPPGFNTSSESILTKPNQLAAVIKKPSKTKQSTKKKASTLSTIEESLLTNSDESSPKLKRKRVTKESLPQEEEMRSICNEEPYAISTQVTSTSMPCFSPLKVPIDLPPPAITSSIVKQSVTVTHVIIPNEPVKVTSSPAKGKSSIQYQPIKVTSSIPNPPVKVTSSIPNKPVNVSSSIANKPVKVTSSIPNKPVDVTSSIPNKPVKVTSSIPNKPVVSISSQSALEPLSTSVPSHLPLKITIPETKFIPITQNKVLHPKGKIVIMKSKSSKYVPSSQPPILITVPTLPTVGHFPISTQCDMNSLEQLSSIAVTRASQAHQYDTRLETKDVEMVDDMDVVSHEVILSASSNSPSQNIVETALKNARIGDEHN